MIDMVGIEAVKVNFNCFEFLIVPIGLNVFYLAKLFFAERTAWILNEPVKDTL